MKHFIIIVYDISNDRRRTRLHDLLLDYGTPVQYSVFECLMTDKEEKEMKQAIRKKIRPRKDSVRTYHLCQDCVSKTEVTCGVEVLHEEKHGIVVG